MWFVALGVVATLLKLFGVSRVAEWEWWLVLSPFAAAAIWWTIADATGLTRRAAAKRQERKVQRRRDSHLAAMGMSTNFGPDSRQGRNSRGAGESRPPKSGSRKSNRP